MFCFYLKVIARLMSSNNGERKETLSLWQNPLSMYQMASCVFQVLKLVIFISLVARTNLTILKLQLCIAGIKISIENLVIKKQFNV